MKKQTPLSIYLHIPFCIRKCLYCDFLSYPVKQDEQTEYVRLLMEEIERQAPFYDSHRVISVFIGGGTPSVLSGETIEAILCKLKENFHIEDEAEITIEVNPGTVTKDKLEAYIAAGINRLSIGLQSADDSLLKTLGRIHDFADFVNTYELARKAGFSNINVDLMSAIPGQTEALYRDTLKKVLEYEPEHISAYSLIVEEGTWFYEHQSELILPSEDEDRRLYEITEELLAFRGFHRYEISNYARDGYECRHNKVYWRRGDYVGFGLGSASMVENVRWSNKSTMDGYRSALQTPCRKEHTDLGIQYRTEHTDLHMPCSEEHTDLRYLRARLAENVQFLTKEEQMEEFMFLGLRLMEGVKKSSFMEEFGLSVEEVYSEALDKLEKNHLIENDNSIRLTPRGIDISNYVMSHFLF